VTLLVDGEEFHGSAEAPFVFGRAEGEGVVGLDANDMGISAVAGSVEFAWGAWWVVNQSTKRPLLLEHPAGPAQLRLEPGHRHPVMTEQLSVLVPGVIATHVVEVVVPEDYAAALHDSDGRLTTGTLVGVTVNLSEREREALAALCAGYLESFPRRREHPSTYAEAAGLLGPGWSADKVRKAVERVKERFASKQAVYFEGPQANYDLAAHLVASSILSGEDLARLPGRRP
jgi:hypothetical protein